MTTPTQFVLLLQITPLLTTCWQLLIQAFVVADVHSCSWCTLRQLFAGYLQKAAAVRVHGSQGIDARYDLKDLETYFRCRTIYQVYRIYQVGVAVAGDITFVPHIKTGRHTIIFTGMALCNTKHQKQRRCERVTWYSWYTSTDHVFDGSHTAGMKDRCCNS